MASLNSSPSIFPEPIPLTCESIHATNINYKLEFLKGTSRYIVRLPTDAPINRTHLDKIIPLLHLNEIDGSLDGVYTWILIDFGEGTPKQILVKQTINITEIGTKHSDILKDICLNKQDIDSVPMSPDNIIRVYFAGELSKTTNQSTGHITYNVNLLSGSYSDGQIDPENFSVSFEEELKNMFITGICSHDETCISSHTINILRTQSTMINTKGASMDSFDRVMIETYGDAGAKVYKFGPGDRNMYTRSGAMADAVYQGQRDMFSRIYKPSDNDYDSKLTELDEKYKPLTSAELQQFLLNKERGGKRSKSKFRKTRKNKRTKKNKRIKHGKKSRKYIYSKKI